MIDTAEVLSLSKHSKSMLYKTMFSMHSHEHLQNQTASGSSFFPLTHATTAFSSTWKQIISNFS